MNADDLVFGFIWNQAALPLPAPEPPNLKSAIWRTKKIMAEIILDLIALEGNPCTVPEIQTLLGGITIGGRKVLDVSQVFNTQEALRHLFKSVESGKFTLCPKIACDLHRLIARGEALEEGVFRRGAVSISGTNFQPPHDQDFETGFMQMASAAERIENPYEKGMAIFLYIARSKCFWAGNRRTGLLLMNGILLAAGQDIISIPSIQQTEFRQKMFRFYESGDATELMIFLLGFQIRQKFESFSFSSD